MPECPTFRVLTADVLDCRSIAWRLHGLLDTESETTVASLATVLSVHKDTVRANLHFLAERGLAARIDRLHWRGTATAPRDRYRVRD